MILSASGADVRSTDYETVSKAVAVCAEKGGGRVVVPKGTHRLNGPIHLKSNVELHLEDGAVLRASADLDDYNALDAFEQNYSITNEQWTGRHFIILHEIENAAITASFSAGFIRPCNNPKRQLESAPAFNSS